jgi:hypothetical protein
MVYQNQPLRMYFTTGIDHVNTTSVILKYRKRDGTEGQKDNPTVQDASIGKYYIDWERDELDELKTWTFWSFVTTVDGGTFPGDAFQYEIVPEGDTPVSRDFIKSFLGISDSSKDVKIDTLIPVLVQQYKEIRNAPWNTTWSQSTGELVNIYPEGLPVTIAYMFDFLDHQDDYNDVTSERIGSYSVSYGSKGAGGFYPKFITSQIKKYVRAE